MRSGTSVQETPGQKAPTVEERATSFRPVEGGNQMQSGEKLLVEAYAIIWIVVLVMVVSMFRRQRTLDRRVATLESALEKARARGESA